MIQRTMTEPLLVLETFKTNWETRAFRKQASHRLGITTRCVSDLTHMRLHSPTGGDGLPAIILRNPLWQNKGQ